MTKILLFKHAYNFVFVFVRNFKQFNFWEMYLKISFTVQWDELIDIRKTYYCYTKIGIIYYCYKKLCNLQYAITYFV